MPFSYDKNKNNKKNISKTVHSPSIMAVKIIILVKRVFSSALIKKHNSLKSAITLEATMLTATFLFITIPLISMVNVINLESQIQISMENVARNISQKSYYTQGIMNSDLISEKITDLANRYQDEEKHTPNISDDDKKKVEKIAFSSIAYAIFLCEMGADNIDKSNVVGGIAGLNFLDSSYDEKTGDISLVLKYAVRLPFLPINVALIRDVRRVNAHLWTGMDLEEDKDIVYITKNGKVYHTSRECTYLNRNVKKIALSDVGTARNESGGKYKECNICDDKKGATDIVYLTGYGDKYHYSMLCSSLNRNIIEINREEVEGMEECSKCKQSKQ